MTLMAIYLYRDQEDETTTGALSNSNGNESPRSGEWCSCRPEFGRCGTNPCPMGCQTISIWAYYYHHCSAYIMTITASCLFLGIYAVTLYFVIVLFEVGMGWCMNICLIVWSFFFLFSWPVKAISWILFSLTLIYMDEHPVNFIHLHFVAPSYQSVYKPYWSRCFSPVFIRCISIMIMIENL